MPGFRKSGHILSVSVNCGNKIEFSFGANNAGFCSDNHMYTEYYNPTSPPLSFLCGVQNQSKKL